MDDEPRFSGEEGTRLREPVKLYSDNWRKRQDLRQPEQTSMRPGEAAQLDKLGQAFDYTDLRLGDSTTGSC